MCILVEIDSEAFMIYEKNGELIAHHVRYGRDYPLHVIATIEPRAVRRAVESLIEKNIISWACGQPYLTAA
jgi:hypothetical protein